MNLGDRIKRYEASYHRVATIRTPLMIRVDGRAFHSFTRGMNRPFDENFIEAMVRAAVDVASEIQGFKAGYVQSDEVTFCLTDYDQLDSQGWFDYDVVKVTSIVAALMSVRFIKHLGTDKTPVFDGRAFSVPAHDVVNAFLWRAKDWKRNSLNMYARSCFSQKALHGKNSASIHEMLHNIGRNWANDWPDVVKNGTFLIKSESGITARFDVRDNYDAINEAIGKLFLLPEQDHD